MKKLLLSLGALTAVAAPVAAVVACGSTDKNTPEDKTKAQDQQITAGAKASLSDLIAVDLNLIEGSGFSHLSNAQRTAFENQIETATSETDLTGILKVAGQAETAAANAPVQTPGPKTPPVTPKVQQAIAGTKENPIVIEVHPGPDFAKQVFEDAKYYTLKIDGFVFFGDTTVIPKVLESKLGAQDANHSYTWNGTGADWKTFLAAASSQPKEGTKANPKVVAVHPGPLSLDNIDDAIYYSFEIDGFMFAGMPNPPVPVILKTKLTQDGHNFKWEGTGADWKAFLASAKSGTPGAKTPPAGLSTTWTKANPKVINLGPGNGVADFVVDESFYYEVTVTDAAVWSGAIPQELKDAITTTTDHHNFVWSGTGAEWNALLTSLKIQLAVNSNPPAQPTKTPPTVVIGTQANPIIENIDVRKPLSSLTIDATKFYTFVIDSYAFSNNYADPKLKPLMKLTRTGYTWTGSGTDWNKLVASI